MKNIVSELIKIANLIVALTPEEKEEALKHYQKRKYTDYGPLFKQQRTYFPFSSKQKEIETPKDIINFLDENGYDILNYRDGLAIKKNNKQQIGIGKVLNRFKRDDLKKLFDERLGTGKKVLEDLKVVISWNPEDIAGMSTDRGWTSCQNLRGDHPQVQVWEKIEGGGMVAYLIYSDDKNIEKPLSRVSIRRYINKSDSSNFIFYPSYVCYGVENKDFVKFVKDKIEENNKETGEEIAEYEEGEGGYLDIFPEKFGLDKWIEKLEFEELTKEQIKKLEDVVIKLGDAKYIYDFSRFAKDVDIKKLEEAIIKSGDAEYISYFAEDIKGADIKKLEDAIIKSGDAERIYYFARYIEGADINKLEDAIIKTGDKYYIFRFAYDIKGADIDKLQEAIIKSGDAEKIYYFARDVKEADIKKLQDAVIKTGEVGSIYSFARYVKEADIDKLQEAMIKSGNAKYISYFAEDIKGADKERLMRIYEELKNKKSSSIISKELRIVNRLLR